MVTIDKKVLIAGPFMLVFFPACSDSSGFNAETVRSRAGLSSSEASKTEDSSPTGEKNKVEAGEGKTGDKEQEHLEEEEHVPAEIPSVISGAYLACSLIREVDKVRCHFNRRGDHAGWNAEVLFFPHRSGDMENLLSRTPVDEDFAFRAPDFSLGRVFVRLDASERDTRMFEVFINAPEGGNLNVEEREFLPAPESPPDDNEMAGGKENTPGSDEPGDVENPDEPVIHLLKTFSTENSVHLGNGQWPLGTLGCEGLEEVKGNLFGANYSFYSTPIEGGKIKSLHIEKLCGVDASNNELRIYDSEEKLVKRFFLQAKKGSFDSGPLDLAAGAYRIEVYSSPYDPAIGVRGEDDFLLKGLTITYAGAMEFSDPFVKQSPAGRGK